MAITSNFNKVVTFFSGFPIFFYSLCSCASPPNALQTNNYGLHVINTPATYEASVKMDSTQQMVALATILTPVITDFQYATVHNFTHQVLYHAPKPYLRLEAALALKKVQDTLHTIGVDIKLFDTYRPYEVTEKMWLIVPDDRYAANPANGSGHNRGIAVDLTMIDQRTGSDLPMPTPFDNFTDSAHHDFMQLSPEVLKNRALLKKAMEQYGFKALPTEWWHYSLPEPKRYGLLNLSFEQLEKLTK